MAPHVIDEVQRASIDARLLVVVRLVRIVVTRHIYICSFKFVHEGFELDIVGFADDFGL